jgi:hypothetical protein
MKSSNIRYFPLFFLLALLPAGCSKNGLVEVEGTVLLDNQPVLDATVLFIPEGGTGQPAQGMTDENGRFQLTTFKDNDGALRGAYKVTVTKSVPPPQPPEAEPGDARSIMAHMKAIRSQKHEKSPLPAIYASEKTTPFRYTVPIEGKLVLELKTSEKK